MDYQKLVQKMVYQALIAMLMAGCGRGRTGPTATPTSVSPTLTSLPTLEPLAKVAELKNDQGPVYSLTWSPEGNAFAVLGMAR